MVESKSRPMDFGGCVMTSHEFDEDQTTDVSRRFIFMCGVEKSKLSIFD